MSPRPVPQRLAFALVIALGVAFRLPALNVARVADDWYQLSMVEGTYPVPRSPFNLYDFIRARPGEHEAFIARGTFPWWTGADLHIAAWRPLASATLSLDHALWGRGTVGPHAHSLLWLAALLSAAAWWLRAVLPRRAALLALALLAVDESVTVPAAWLANRPALMSTTFGLLAMGLLARRRGAPTARGSAPVAALALAAMLSGEYGFALAGAAVAWELAAGAGARRERVAASLAVAIPCALYLAAWRAQGYGAGGTRTYVDPIGHAGAWLAQAGGRLVELLGELCLAFPMELTWGGVAAFQRVLVGLAAAALLVAAALARADAATRGASLGLVAATLAAVVPVLSAPPSGRLLLAAAPMFSALLASLVVCAWSPRDGASAARTWGLRAPVALWVVVHLATPAALSWALLCRMAQRDPSRVAFRALPGVDACRARDLDYVLLGAGGFNVVHVLPLFWMGTGCERPRTWRVLATAPGEAIFVRTGDRTAAMQGLRGPLFGAFTRDWHAAPFRAGERVALGTFSAEVTAVDAGLPSRVTYAFDRSLDDPHVVLWVSVPGGYAQVRPPPVNGGRVVSAPAAWVE